MKVNSEYCKLQSNYLFTEVVNRTRRYKESHPDANILRLGIGDVCGPLAPRVIEALHKAVDMQAHADTFQGYGLEEGAEWLRQAIADFDYGKRLGIPMQKDEIFISDGAASDLSQLCDIIGINNKVAIADPVYPAYVDTNVMAGRAGDWMGDHWSEIILLPCTPENDFCPAFPSEVPDVIYLCSPNNPTGTAMTREQMQRWVDYAKEHHSLIIFDGAYEAFVASDDVPHSIYECDGAREVAIEVRSFSKIAGFTGVRCGYTVVPHELMGENDKGEWVSVNRIWYRHQCTRYNGTSIISQRGAMEVLTDEGHAEVMKQIAIYRQNALYIREFLTKLGLHVYGGENSPYVWVKVPEGMDSWSFFDLLLEKCQVVCTPGVGFGTYGEGFVRFSAFNRPSIVEEAMARVRDSHIFQP